jgi:hypothetical protein
VGIYHVLDETKIACEGSFLYSNPLHRLDRVFAHFRASFHHICHFRDGYHFETAWVDATHSSCELFNVREFVSLQVNRSWRAFTLKNLKHEKWCSIVQILNQLVCQSQNELSLHARLDFEAPKFRVFVTWQCDVPHYHLSDVVLVVWELILH